MAPRNATICQRVARSELTRRQGIARQARKRQRTPRKWTLTITKTTTPAAEPLTKRRAMLPDANADAIAVRLQRADVSPGVGIAITPTAGSQTGLTISSSSGTGNITLTGGWTWVALTPVAGEIMPTDSVVPPAIDTWIFNATGGQYANDRTALLSAAIGDTLEIVQSPTRFQVITLTEVPTLNQFTVTVTGSGSRTGGTGQLWPAGFQTVTVTLVPGPLPGVDQTARNAAQEANDDADAAQTSADDASAEITAHEGTQHNRDDTARNSAATAQTAIDEHEANHPGGSGGVVNVSDGRLPFDPVEMRIGWLQTPTTPVNAATFAPPATVGTTTQTLIPDFPQDVSRPEPTPCQPCNLGRYRP